MLRANVGLSRKVSKDFNSTGYSINIDGELTAPVSDPEAVIEEVQRLYDLAEKALNLQIRRSTGCSANGSGGANRPSRAPATHHGNGRPPVSGDRRGVRMEDPTSETPQEEEPATQRQVQYLLNIGKRRRMSAIELEHEIEQILGQQVGVYDLGKRQAARVIDVLTTTTAGNGNGNGNGNGRH